MNPRVDAWSIVLAGAWNPRIFTPAWLGEHVFGVTELQIEFPAQSGFPYRYTANDVRLVPSADKIVLSPTEASEDALLECERQALVLLRTLAHTPMLAIGINLGFVEEEPSADVLRIFALSDSAELATAGYVVETREIRRLLSYADSNLNLRLAHIGAQVQADFNFHRAVTTTAEAVALLEGSSIPHLHRATELLEAAYDFDIEMETV